MRNMIMNDKTNKEKIIFKIKRNQWIQIFEKREITKKSRKKQLKLYPFDYIFY